MGVESVPYWVHDDKYALIWSNPYQWWVVSPEGELVASGRDEHSWHGRFSAQRHARIHQSTPGSEAGTMYYYKVRKGVEDVIEEKLRQKHLYV